MWCILVAQDFGCRSEDLRYDTLYSWRRTLALHTRPSHSWRRTLALHTTVAVVAQDFSPAHKTILFRSSRSSTIVSESSVLLRRQPQRSSGQLAMIEAGGAIELRDDCRQVGVHPPFTFRSAGL